MTGRLYLHSSNDNVAQALEAIEAGEEVSVITVNGRHVSSVVVRVRVPKHYHVSIRNLKHDDPVIKDNWEIGRVIAEYYDPGDRKNKSVRFCGQLGLPRGYPVHLGNFIPSKGLWEIWGNDLAVPADLIDKIGETEPYQIAKMAGDVAEGKEITLSNLSVTEDLRVKLFPGLDAAFVVGKTFATLPEGTLLRLGFCRDKKPLLKTDEKNIGVMEQWRKLVSEKIPTLEGVGGETQ